MSRTMLLACLGLASSASAWADCGAQKSELLFEYVSTSPLLIAESDASSIVQVDKNGCAVVHLPAHDVRRGDYRWALPEADRARLKQRIDAANQHHLVQAQLERSIKAASEKSGLMMTIRDENLIELHIAKFDAGTKSETRLQLSGLRQALAHLPDRRDLQALAALGAEAEAIADRAVAAKSEPQP
jgi:hypothetical protein